MASPQSKDDWKAHLDAALSDSLRAVSDRITRVPAVQEWLRTASMEVAEGLGSASGVQGEMQGYMRMRNALEDRFPELVAAVEELTEGCGHVDLHWRPMNPNFSRVEVAFDRDVRVDLFVRLADLTPEAARDALYTVVEALPDGAPFPNRPHTVTGLVAHDGTALGVRVREHMAEEGQGRMHTVTLLPASGDALEKLSGPEAVERLLQELSSADDSSLN